MVYIGRFIRTWILPDRAIILFCAILLVSVWAAALWQAEYDLRTTVERVTRDGDKFTRAFEEHVRTILKKNDEYLAFMKKEYEKSQTATPAIESLFEHLRDDPKIIQASLADKAGNFVASSLPGARGANVADVPHFAVHVPADMGRTYIGKPLFGRVSQRTALHMTRRMNDATGGFAGVATLVIDPYYFSKFYQDMNLSEHYTLRLIGLDGTIRASNSLEEIGFDFSQAVIFGEAAKQPTGFYYAPGTYFGKSGYMSYRVLPDFPLIVQVGLSDKALVPLAQRRNAYFAAAGGASVFVLLYTGRLLQRARRQRLADADLQASYRQLAAIHEELVANEEELRANYTALSNERAFSAAVLESVPGLLYLYDESGRMVRWNKNHETATGYSAEELANMHLADWYRGDEETLERISREVGKAFDVGIAFAEAGLQNKDGSKTPYYFTAVKTVIDNKPYIVGIGIDITDRKRMETALADKEKALRRSLDELTASHEELMASEEELRALNTALRKSANDLAASEHKLRELFEHMRDAFALHELILNEAGEPVDWRYLFVNAAFEKVCGRSRSEILGRTASEATPEIPLQELLGSYRRVALTGEPVHDISYADMSGKLYSVRAYSPERMKFAVLAIDVTEQKKAEDLLRRKDELLQKSYDELSSLYEKVVLTNEQLEQSRRTVEDIFHAAGDGFVVCDGGTGAILAVNRRMTEIFGYTEEEFKRDGIALISTPANVEDALAMLRRTAAEGPQPLFEQESRDREGRRVVMEISVTPVTIGGKTRCLALIRDVTVRRQLEEGLEFLRMRDPLTGVFNRSYFETDMLRGQAGEHAGIGMFVCDVDGLKLINDTLGHRQGDDLLRKVAGILAAGVDLPDYVARIGGDEFAVVLREPTRERMEELYAYYCAQVADYNDHNPHLPLSLSLGWAMGAGNYRTEYVFKEADNNMYRQKLHQSQSVHGAIVQTMMKALEERDHITEGHADRLGNLMEKMGRQLMLPQGTLADLRLLAKFHDIGKVGIPDSILNKPGRLTDEEMAVMQRHCEIGYRIAKASPDLEPIADWILKHQEHWNGGGYPLGLAGESIPLECRILGIVDAFDAMTNDRPYRKAMPPEAALAELRRCAGRQFDPNLVELFISLVEPA
jgi:diguanylate cyclase (GGDEF)-like protein/PAS domain S-box-containing protein